MVTQNNITENTVGAGQAIDSELDWFAKQREAAALLFDLGSLSLFAGKASEFQQK